MSIFSEILMQHGENAVLRENGEEREIKVFIQPIINRAEDRTWHKMTELGEYDASRYYYFGPAEVEIGDCDGTCILYNGQEYRFLKAEAFRVEGKISHWEGVLKKKEEIYDGRA